MEKIHFTCKITSFLQSLSWILYTFQYSINEKRIQERIIMYNNATCSILVCICCFLFVYLFSFQTKINRAHDRINILNCHITDYIVDPNNCLLFQKSSCSLTFSISFYFVFIFDLFALCEFSITHFRSKIIDFIR